MDDDLTEINGIKSICEHGVPFAQVYFLLNFHPTHLLSTMISGNDSSQVTHVHMLCTHEYHLNMLHIMQNKLKLQLNVSINYIYHDYPRPLCCLYTSK